MEDQYKKALFAMTQMKSVLDLLFAIIAVAVVPAFVEELFLGQAYKNINGLDREALFGNYSDCANI